MINRSLARQIGVALLVAVATGVLAGCGTRYVSRDISPEGVAGEVVFPDPAYAVLVGGTMPDLDALRAIGSGVTKDQLYQALGRPHFREGLVGVREWDYLFQFRTADGPVSCQYKVIFDSEYRGQSFHWLPAYCLQSIEAAADASAAL